MNFHFLIQIESNCMNTFLLYIYSVLFPPVMTCWFVRKILSTTRHQHGTRYSKCSTSFFLPTFLSICLIYLESLYSRHQSFPGIIASSDFKESWVVRSGLKLIKAKKKKKVLWPNRMLHYALRKELNIHHLNGESVLVLQKEHPS